jgi:hypothetical protein
MLYDRRPGVFRPTDGRYIKTRLTFQEMVFFKEEKRGADNFSLFAIIHGQGSHFRGFV